jgi:hypothetical protein
MKYSMKVPGLWRPAQRKIKISWGWHNLLSKTLCVGHRHHMLVLRVGTLVGRASSIIPL